MYNTPGWAYNSYTVDGDKWDFSGLLSGGSASGMNGILMKLKTKRNMERRLVKISEIQT